MAHAAPFFAGPHLPESLGRPGSRSVGIGVEFEVSDVNTLDMGGNDVSDSLNGISVDSEDGIDAKTPSRPRGGSRNNEVDVASSVYAFVGLGGAFAG